METTSGSDAGQEPPVAAQPPPSPLSGAYLLIVVGEPHTDAHKQDILRKIANGFLSWDVDSCHVALDKELQAIIAAAPDGEEARNGERLIQFASENLVTEVLIQPQLNTLIQCIRNLLSSFTKHRHIIHAGYTFAGNGSWIVQDGTFSLADLIDALQEPEVQRVLRAYEHSVTVDIHCAPEGDWSTARLRREACTRLCRVRVNPDDGPSPAANIQQFVDYLAPFVRPQSIDQLLHPSDVVGNIRFSHPTLYVFPGGQGDAALFGINGFNMLVDGGFARKACFWDFVRHLDRLDAVLMTRINNSNCHGLASILRRKRLSHVYPQIGHFFCNLQERKQPSTPDEEKVRDPLLVNLLDEGQEIVQNLRHLQLKPHNCVRDSVLEPINLYHKVGHGKLDMYVISPARDSKELKEFLSKWHSNDISLFNSVSRKPGDKDITFPFQNLVSICALLVWQPANPEDTITRILFPGSTPQHKIFEGLEKLRSLDFMKQPVCTAKTLSPSSSTIGLNTKVSKTKSTPAVIDKLLPGEGLNKPIPKGVPQTEPVSRQAIAKAATIPVSGTGEIKSKPVQPLPPKSTKPKQEKQKQEKDNKTEVDRNIEVDAGENVKQEKSALITDQLKEKDSIKIKNEKSKAENKTKKIESKVTSRITEKKPPKVPSFEKKDSVKSSPTTPKKSVESKVNGVASKAEIVKSTPKPKLKTSPSSTPAKSTKEENNRKVVESKAKAAIASKTSAPKHPKRDDSVVKQKQDKKPPKKPSTSSPIKLPSKTFSPVKGATKTVSKIKKDSKKVKGEIEKGIITDSSAVSTPSTVDAETAIAKEGKYEGKDKVEKVVEKDVDSGKFEEKVEDDTSKDIDESAEAKEKAEEASVSEDVISIDKQEDRHIDTSEKEYSEKEEEDEILIIEKVEIEQYGDDSVQDQESLESHVPDDGEDEIQKHLRDEAESEKKKDDQPKTEEIQDKGETKSIAHDDQIEKDIPTGHEDKGEIKPSDLTLSLVRDISTEKVLTPENREQIEEEVQEIITSATDFVAKAKLEQSKESSELSADGIGSDEQKTSGETKDLLSSPEKLQALSDKNFTDDDNKQDDTKDRSKEIGDVRYTAEESQPDEKISTTVESGATTAPTLPEDERIPLDEIKEGVEEKYDKEDTKEKETQGAAPGRMEQPTTLPQVSIVPGGPYEVQATQILRDIVKTPDEVADLPVHEEVDGVYEEDDFSRDPSKSKEDLLSIGGKKDVDIKEDKKDGLPEEKETLEFTKEGTLLSKDEIAKRDELREDIRIDEEELNELKCIRQNLEAEDSNQEHRDTNQQPLSKGLDTDDSKQEIVLETEPVHSMLKAPEVAEIVMVTPDSAPDSPLHLSTEKKDKTDGLPIADYDQDGKGLDHSTHISRYEPSHTIKSEEIEESLDTLVSLKKTIDTPKTPPASPVLGDIAKEKDKIDIIPDIAELAGISKDVIDQKSIQKIMDETKGKSDLQAIPESSSPIQNDKIDTALTGKEPVEFETQQVVNTDEVTASEASKSTALNLSDKIYSLLPENEISQTEKTIQIDDKKGDLNQKETEQSVSERPELPEKVTQLSGTKKDSPQAQKEGPVTEKQESPVSLSPLPVDMGESPKLEKEQTVKEKLEYPKSISPVLSGKEDSTILGKGSEEADTFELSKTVNQEEHKLLPSISPISSDKVDINASEKESSITDTKESLVSKSPVSSDENETNKNIKEPSSTQKHELPISVSPLIGDKADFQLTEKELNVIEKQESSQSICPEPSVTTDYKTNDDITVTPEKRDSPKRISPTGSNEDESKLTEIEPAITEKHESLESISPDDMVDFKPSEKDQGVLRTQEFKTSTSATATEKEDSKTIEDIAELHESTLGISPAPSEKVDAKPVDQGVEKYESPKSISPSGKIETQSTENESSVAAKKDSPKSISPLPDDKGTTESLEKLLSLKEIHESPISGSPAPTEKIEASVTEKEPPAKEKQFPPAGVSSVSSYEANIERSTKENEGVPDNDNEKHFKESLITEKHELPKGESFVPTDKVEKQTEKVNKEEEDSSILHSRIDRVEPELSKNVIGEKDSLKSSSPVSNESVDDKPSEKGNVNTEKKESQICVSPLPCEKVESKSLETVEGFDDKHDTPKCISPVSSVKVDQKDSEKEQDLTTPHIVPSDTEPAKATEKSGLYSETHSSLTNISPMSSKEEDTKILEKESTVLEKYDSPKSISPVPSYKEEDKSIEKEQPVTEKHDTPKTISPVPSKQEESILEIIDTPRSISPLPSDKTDVKAIQNDEIILEQGDTPKSISPVSTDKGDAEAVDKENGDITKTTSPVRSIMKNIEAQEKEETHPAKHESISPMPSDKDDSKIMDKEHVVLEKLESPKTVSPVPSDKEDPKNGEKMQMEPKTYDNSKSVSPVPSDKGDPKTKEIEQSIVDKSDTPKCISPVPSEKVEIRADEKQKTVSPKPDTPQSISPVPFDTISHEKGHTILEKQDPPKSISPVPSDRGDTTAHEKEQPILDKQDTPKTISPVPSDRGDTTAHEKGQPILEKQDTPKSISPVPSGREDTIAHEKEQPILEKQDTPKTISPVLSDREGTIAHEKEQPILEKQDTPKSISPVPSDREDTTAREKEQPILEKQDTPKTISPVLSDREGTIAHEKEQPILEKQDTPKSISPVPSDREDTTAREKEQPILEKQDTPKSISPMPSDREDTIAHEKGQKILEKQDTPKTISPVPSDREDTIAHEKGQPILEKQDTPKTISPVPSDIGDTIALEKGQPILEKQDTPKSTSPVPSDRGDTIANEKGQPILEKQETPKNISPVPSDKGDTIANEKGQPILEKQDTPKSISPVPSNREDTIAHEKEQPILEKQDTPKSISPVPSDRRDTITHEKGQPILEKQDTPKSISPVPSGREDTIAHEKEQPILEKQDTPKTISPVLSDREGTIAHEKEQPILEKQDTPKSISPVPSDREDTTSREKEQPILEKQDTPKSISPMPSDREDTIIHEKVQTILEKQDTPKSISPVLMDKREAKNTEEEQILPKKQDSSKTVSPELVVKKCGIDTEQEQTTSEKHDTPKSISPVPSEKGDAKITDKEDTFSEKHDSPKRVSPVPADKVDGKEIETEQTILEKHDSPKSISPDSADKGGNEGTKEGKTVPGKLDSPKSISPMPSNKEEAKDFETEPSVSEKHDFPKSISPVASEKGDSKGAETEQLIIEKHETTQSISPVPSENGNAKSGQNQQTVSEKHDSPKCTSPLSYDKELSIETGKEQTILERHDTPKSISPVLFDKGDVQARGKQQTVIEKLDTPKSVSPVFSDKAEAKAVDKEQTLPEKHDTPKSISPAPSDKGDDQKSEKEQSIEKQDTPKSISPLPSDKGSSERAEEELSLKEKHDSPKSSSPVLSDASDNRQSEKETDVTKQYDLSKNISPTHSNKVDSKIDDETETEKADTELSEKDKGKQKLVIQLTHGSSAKELGDDQLADVTLDRDQVVCKTFEPSAISGLKDIGEQNLMTGKESASEIETTGNVIALDSVYSSSEQPVTNYHSSSSSSSKIVDSKPATVTTDKQLGSSDLISSTPLSTVSDQTPLSVNDKDDTRKSNVVLCTGKDTVIEKTLQSKSIKTEKDIKADSESIVPSNLISSGLDSTLKDSSADLSIKDSSTHSSVDHRSTEITEHSSETKSGLHSVDISSVSSDKGDKSESLGSTKEEISSSVHRMLVTGSSEDGGTETELCSSSVTKLPGGSYDTNLGNVAHIPKEESTTSKQEPTIPTEKEDITKVLTSSILSDLPPEKTVITTTVYTTDGQKETKINESTKPSDVVKTITTTITKTFGDHPTTDIKTTEDIVPSSGEKSSPVDFEKTGKKSEAVSSGILSQSFKKEVSDVGRSGTPASDLASERELETGGISTPHSDISSGQVSRAATHVWGESSEGRPDSRHCDSDDDIPCSPMSATSHIAQSPPQFDFDIHQHAKEGFLDETSKSKDSSLPAAMTSSLYGSLPDDPLEEYIKEKQLPGESQMYSSMYVSKYGDDDEEDSKPVISETKSQSGVVLSKTEDIDFETAIKEHRSVRGEDLTVKYTNGKPEASVNGKSTHSVLSTNGLSNGKSSQPESLEYQESQTSSTVSSNIMPKSVPSQPPVSEISSSSSAKPSVEEKKDPIEGWGKPLGLPPPPKNLIDSPLSQSTLTLVWNPADEWGLPLGLPSPAPPPVKKDSMNGEIDTEITSTSNKTTPKKVARRNAENNKSASNALIGKEASNKSKHPESPVKRASNKDAKSKSVSPVYMDLTYVPHHGNSNYTNVEFFKRIRARYYVFSGTEPSREVFNALLEAKQTWEDKDLEVTIIPTYDTDTLGYWVAENEDLLAKYKIDLSPSASRCTINLQDHETSCSAYRLEF